LLNSLFLKGLRLAQAFFIGFYIFLVVMLAPLANDLKGDICMKLLSALFLFATLG